MSFLTGRDARRANEECYHETPTGRVVRVTGNNLLVRLDPEKRESDGGIFIPDTVLKSLHRTGEVVAIGHLTGEKLEGFVSIPGLRRGAHVLFVRFHEKSGANPSIQENIDENLLCIRPADVLLVMDADEVKRVG